MGTIKSEALDIHLQGRLGSPIPCFTLSIRLHDMCTTFFMFPPSPT